MKIEKRNGDIWITVTREQLLDLLFDADARGNAIVETQAKIGPICRMCGEPAVEGKKLCKRHLRKFQKSAANARAARKAKKRARAAK